MRMPKRWRALDADKRRLEELLAAVGEAIITIDAHNRIVGFNREAEHIFQYQAREAIGQPLAILLPRGMEETHKVHVAAFSRSGQQRRHMGGRPEIRGRRRDGTEFIAEAAISKLEIDGDVFFTAVLRDVSHQKETESALRTSEARFRDVAELVAEWLWETDRDGRITFVSGRSRNWTSLDESPVIGKTIDQLFDASAPPPLEFSLRVAAREPFGEVPCAVRGGDGVLRQIVLAGKPMFDEKGTFIGYRGAARDVTLEVEMKERLNRQNSDLRQILAALEITEAGLVLCDERERITYINSSALRLLGLPSGFDEIIGRHVRDLGGFPIGGEESCDSLLSSANDVRWQGTRTWRRPEDGRRIFCDVRLHRLPEGGFVAIVIDATARVRDAEEDRLRREQRSQASKVEALGTLAGGIAHDFNNLLGAIHGYAEFVAEDADTESKTYRYAQQILAISRRGRSLIDQILGFTRQAPIQAAVVSLNEIAVETVTLLRATLPATTELRFESLAEEALVRVDKSQLVQILMNLCVNASDALGGRFGRVAISVQPFERAAFDLCNSSAGPEGMGRACPDLPGASCMLVGQIPSGPCLSLKVGDSGPGIPAALLDRIFEPFFTTKDVGRGTGLGLAVVRRIVLEAGGAILVQTVENKGATFEVVLERVAEINATPAVPQPERRVRSDVRAPRAVLVVDDDEAHVAVIETALARAGHRVQATRDPELALEWLSRADRKWDVLVTDQTMPRVRGSDLVRAFRAHNPAGVCVLCTGYGGGSVSQDIRDAQPDGTLFKPFDTANLVALIDELLRSKKSNEIEAQ